MMNLAKSNQIDGSTMVSMFRILVGNKTPFFTVLSYNCKFVGQQTVAGGVACTNGQTVFFSTEVFNKFTNQERTAVFLHELLHVAYGHVGRRKHRDPKIWNIAADIYCNNIIQELDFCKLPEGGVLEPDMWRETTEEIYELLKQNPDVTDKYQDGDQSIFDLIEGSSTNEEGNPQPGLTPEELEALGKEWERLLDVANQAQLDKSDKYGKLPGKLSRTLDALKEPQIDWRQALLNYLVKSPNDYQGFDRRFISQGMYNDTLDGTTVRVDVCIDTSGSIGAKELQVFVTELAGILNSYPEVLCDLYWADTEAYGPYELSDISKLPKPEGGGGTCFRDFFIKSQSPKDREPATIAIYLTDGYGSFPLEEPAGLDTLWVVTHNGIKPSQFPFGMAVKLTTD